jgi:hypothetical protein
LTIVHDPINDCPARDGAHRHFEPLVFKLVVILPLRRAPQRPIPLVS